MEIPTTKVERLKLLKRNRGLLARVARKLGLTPQHVGEVYHGRPSLRVRRAIEAEIVAAEAAADIARATRWSGTAGGN